MDNIYFLLVQDQEGGMIGREYTDKEAVRRDAAQIAKLQPDRKVYIAFRPGPDGVTLFENELYGAKYTGTAWGRT